MNQNKLMMNENKLLMKFKLFFTDGVENVLQTFQKVLELTAMSNKRIPKP